MKKENRRAIAPLREKEKVYDIAAARVVIFAGSVLVEVRPFGRERGRLYKREEKKKGKTTSPPLSSYFPCCIYTQIERNSCCVGLFTYRLFPNRDISFLFYIFVSVFIPVRETPNFIKMLVKEKKRSKYLFNSLDGRLPQVTSSTSPSIGFEKFPDMFHTLVLLRYRIHRKPHIYTVVVARDYFQICWAGSLLERKDSLQVGYYLFTDSQKTRCRGDIGRGNRTEKWGTHAVFFQGYRLKNYLERQQTADFAT